MRSLVRTLDAPASITAISATSTERLAIALIRLHRLIDVNQRHAPTPAPRELRQCLLSRQLQTGNDRLHSLLQAPAIFCFYRLLNPGHTIHILGLGVNQRVVFNQQLTDIFQARSDGIKYRDFIRIGKILLQTRDLRRGLHPERTVIESHLATDDFQ